MRDVGKKYQDLTEELSWVQERLARVIYIMAVSDARYVTPNILRYRAAYMRSLINHAVLVRKLIDDLVNSVCFQIDGVISVGSSP